MYSHAGTIFELLDCLQIFQSCGSLRISININLIGYFPVTESLHFMSYKNYIR